jgi:hypothetical protein
MTSIMHEQTAAHESIALLSIRSIPLVRCIRSNDSFSYYHVFRHLFAYLELLHHFGLGLVHRLKSLGLERKRVLRAVSLELLYIRSRKWGCEGSWLYIHRCVLVLLILVFLDYSLFLLFMLFKVRHETIA